VFKKIPCLKAGAIDAGQLEICAIPFQLPLVFSQGIKKMPPA